MRVTHTTLAGSLIDMDAPFDVSQSWTNLVTAVVDGTERHQFASGPLGFAEACAREIVEVQEFDEEYSFQGGQLRFGTGPLSDPVTNYTTFRRTAVWDGASFSFHTTISEGQYPDLLALLSRFEIRETASGISLLPRDASIVFDRSDRSMGLLHEVPGLGLVEVAELNSINRRRVPGWRGERVRGGELYIENPGTDMTRLILIGESMIARIIPDYAVGENASSERASEILIEWTG